MREGKESKRKWKIEGYKEKLSWFNSSIEQDILLSIQETEFTYLNIFPTFSYIFLQEFSRFHRSSGDPTKVQKILKELKRSYSCSGDPSGVQKILQ